MQLYTKESLNFYLNYVRNKLKIKLHFDEYTFYKKAEIVTIKQLELVDKGWDAEDIAKASYILIEKWLKIA